MVRSTNSKISKIYRDLDEFEVFDINILYYKGYVTIMISWSTSNYFLFWPTDLKAGTSKCPRKKVVPFKALTKSDN